MIKLKFTGPAFCKEISEGIHEVFRELGFVFDEKGMEVELVSSISGLSIEKSGSKTVIGFNKRVELFRALTLLVQHMDESTISISESSKCDMLGAMVDNSRNAVMNVPSIKRLLRYMALMGHNTLMLYTEDTYEIEGYPYFGYMRGRFTSEELRECDDYAKMMGIELVPCIQTLAHLNAAFKWHAFSDVRDCNDILLAGSEKTYDLIDAMLSSMSKNLRSRNINIGMDEAEMLGLGKYLEKNGYSDRSEIMLNHLKRVVELCRKYNYKPMMWSDMFFRLASSGSYYDSKSMPEEVTGKVPKDVSLIYWDYYNTESEKVSRILDKHLQFNNPCIFAGGAWRWRGYAPLNEHSFLNSRIIIEQCNIKGVNNMFVTAWGDDGSECSMFTILPVLQLFAENAYTGKMDDTHVSQRLKATSGVTLEDFLLMDRPNLVPGVRITGMWGADPAKYLLYQDILMGLFDKHVDETTYSEHYRRSGLELSDAAARNPQWKNLFISLAHLCDILELKCDMGIRLKKAYDTKDEVQLKEICSQMDDLLDRVSVFYEDIRSFWMSENKPFGFDVISMRFGALKTRIQEAQRRVREYLDGMVERLEELEQDRLYYDCRNNTDKGLLLEIGRWSEIITANVV